MGGGAKEGRTEEESSSPALLHMLSVFVQCVCVCVCESVSYPNEVMLCSIPTLWCRVAWRSGHT